MVNKRNNKYQKGSAILIVIVVIAVMMLLAVSFLDSAHYTYRFTKMLGDGDSTFFAAESASRKWFSFIKDKLSGDPNKYYVLKFKLEYKKEADYVYNVLDSLKKENAIFQNPITVNGDQQRNFNCDFIKFEVHDAIKDVDKKVIRAKVGIISVSSCFAADTPETIFTNNKRLYFEDILEVPYFEPVKLTYSILSIGDVIANGNGYVAGAPQSVNIIGDILSFGTFPIKTISPKQYFYGGIMAIKNAQLNIYGNAYTRGFVRAGAYYNDSSGIKVTDSSEINVSRDIFAQCIQTFSRYSKIFGYRNAYTLDDLEINGEDSTLGINGSFFGLSDNKTSMNHDENSCILNSSALHYTLNQSSTSRVVINGDVLLGGAGYKISPEGTGLFEIESGGLIYPEDKASEGYSINVPTYKYEDEISKLKLGSDKDLSFAYAKFLKDATIRKFGYVNIIQAYPKVNTGFAFGNISGGINTWKSEIGRLVKDPANVDNSNYNNRWNPKSAFTPKNRINGVTGSTIIGANDAIYWNAEYKKDTGLLGAGRYGVDKLSLLPDNFQIDGFLPSEIESAYKISSDLNPPGLKIISDKEQEEDFNELTGSIVGKVDRFWKYYWSDKNITDWTTYWNFANNPTSPLYTATGSASDYINLMKQEEAGWVNGFKAHLPNLKDLVQAKLNKIVQRNYPPQNVSEWSYETTKTIDDTIDKIDGFQKLNNNGRIVIIRESYSGKNNVVSENISKYFAYNLAAPALLVCKDSNIDIIVDGTFRGIIITKGRVVVKGNGKVLGAVVATGRNKDDFNFSTTDSDASNKNGYFNRTNTDNNLNDIVPLNDGVCAGIVLDASAGGTPTIDFYMGRDSRDPKYNSTYGNFIAREEMLKDFEAIDIHLYQIL